MTMKLLPIRLSPGADLRRALEAALAEQGADSAFVLSGIGSLHDGFLRFANEPLEMRIAGPLELVSISGSLSADGAHLHAAVADRDGKVTGGHLGYGNFVRTTAELLLAVLPQGSLAREHDEQTGFKELVVRTRQP